MANVSHCIGVRNLRIMGNEHDLTPMKMNMSGEMEFPILCSNGVVKNSVIKLLKKTYFIMWMDYFILSNIEKIFHRFEKDFTQNTSRKRFLNF